MPDVFISYAREDRATAERLAGALEGRGVGVWWDAELLSSDDFHDVIHAALTRAKAAVVIWSKHSVKSRFVRDEARFALHYDKLVATKQPDVDVFDIPFGFQGQHTDDVNDHERILLAIEGLGVKPQVKAAPLVSSAADVDWNAVKASANVAALLDFLAKHPASAHHEECLARLRSLTGVPERTAATHPAGAPSIGGGGLAEAGESEPRMADFEPKRRAEAAERAKAAEKAEAERDRVHAEVPPPEPKSRFRAFLSGFSWRLPEFQSIETGTYAALGGATFYIVLAIMAPGLIMANMTPQPYGYSVLAATCLLISLFGYRRFHGWLSQRNFRAAVIIALAASGVFGLGVMSVVGATEAVAKGPDNFFAIWIGAGLAAMGVFMLQVYRAR